MLGFLPILTLIINALGTALPLIPGVSATIAKTSTDLATGVVGLLAGIVPGQAASSDVIAALSGAMALLTTLKADTSIAPDKLTLIDNLIGEIQAAIVAYVSAGTGFNASNYAQIAPVA
jgi:hypothetical protein